MTAVAAAVADETFPPLTVAQQRIYVLSRALNAPSWIDLACGQARADAYAHRTDLVPVAALEDIAATSAARSMRGFLALCERHCPEVA